MIAIANKTLGACLVLGSAGAMWFFGEGNVYIFWATVLGVILYVNGEIEERIAR